MLGSRFLWQVWGVLGFTLVISTLVFGYLVADQVQRDSLERTEQMLLDQAHGLSAKMGAYLEAQEVLQPDKVQDLTPGIVARITLITSEGRVLADNQSDPTLMDNHLKRPEVQLSSLDHHGFSTRYSKTLHLSMLYLALPIESSAGTKGFLRLALPLTSIEEQMTALQRRVYLSTALSGLMFLAIGYFLAFRVTNPIARMTEQARRVARGQYDLRLPENRKDEIGQLAAVINELALGAQERIDELTNNSSQLGAILAGLTEGVVAVEPDGQVMHVNEAATVMLALGVDHLRHHKFDDLPISKEIKQAVATCIEEQTNVVSTVLVGSQTLASTCVLMGSASDKAAGAILVLEDITEKVRLEEVRSDFVANASHELKTPISAIRGLVETIIDDPEMPADIAASFTERIRRQTMRLDNVVQDLLQLSRYDSSAREKSVTRIDLTNLLRQVYEAKAYDASDAGIKLNLDLQVDSLEVEGEPEGLNQLVTNLVDNALKYTGEDGLVQLRLLKHGSMAHIEVEDNGIGIAIDERQRIFERFYRVDRARSRELGGTGLGLAIVKHIAQSHQGSVSVRSQLGSGSTFVVQLPLAEPV
jgi:two-component system phosphate regulon sensor histidine kinase PhoR